MTSLNFELRYWRRKAHQAIDPLCEGKERRTIRAIYNWLADEMGIPHDQMRIKHLDIEQCKQLIHIIKTRRKEARINGTSSIDPR